MEHLPGQSRSIAAAVPREHCGRGKRFGRIRTADRNQGGGRGVNQRCEIKLGGEIVSASTETAAQFSEAIQRYFNLMYDCDVSRFDQVFHATAQLHGVRDGGLTVWPAATYREVFSKRQAPKSAGAPREEEILMIDFTSS